MFHVKHSRGSELRGRRHAVEPGLQDRYVGRGYTGEGGGLLQGGGASGGEAVTGLVAEWEVGVGEVRRNMDRRLTARAVAAAGFLLPVGLVAQSGLDLGLQGEGERVRRRVGISYHSVRRSILEEEVRGAGGIGGGREG